jgi:hypothetical protein
MFLPLEIPERFLADPAQVVVFLHKGIMRVFYSILRTVTHLAY